MRKHSPVVGMLSAALMLVSLAATVRANDLPTATQEALTTSNYVYIASTRKDGSLGKAAEIWFMYHKGAVYVASPPAAYRVRRIRAGRPGASIAVGKPDGPSFKATGAIVNDPDVHAVLFETFAKKYPDGWPRHEDNFRRGLRDGRRVLIKYTPQP